MADKEQGADKTEKPTPKRLQDARKRGDVPKSREITSTVELIGWLAVAGLFGTLAGERLAGLMEAPLQQLAQPFEQSARAVGMHALNELLVLTLACLVPIILAGLLAEYLQVGPVMTAEKMKPTLDKLNPAEGLKRMFSVDNLVEVAKLLVKTALLLVLLWIVVHGSASDLANLHAAPPAALGTALWTLFFRMCALTVIAFALLALLDGAYQRYSFTKKLRMSVRDIRQEIKDNEGDPLVKGRRRQLHQEWSQRNSVQAARNAAVLVINPTHIAIALDYDPDTCPIPVVSGKGEDEVALAMRAAAEAADVPVLQQVELARSLNERAAIGAIVPSDLFDAVAQVIVWAREQRDRAGRAQQDPE